MMPIMNNPVSITQPDALTIKEASDCFRGLSKRRRLLVLLMPIAIHRRNLNALQRVPGLELSLFRGFSQNDSGWWTRVVVVNF